MEEALKRQQNQGPAQAAVGGQAMQVLQNQLSNTRAQLSREQQECMLQPWYVVYHLAREKDSRILELEEELASKINASSGLNGRVNHLAQMNQQLQQMNRGLNQQLSEAQRSIGMSLLQSI